MDVVEDERYDDQRSDDDEEVSPLGKQPEGRSGVCDIGKLKQRGQPGEYVPDLALS
jgi:hypothetical protein